VIGTIALAIFIWQLGPMFAFGDARPLESRGGRIVAILLAVAWGVGRIIAGRVQARYMNARVADMLRAGASGAKQAGGGAKQAEFLNERFSGAMNALRTLRIRETNASPLSRLFDNGRYIYELPWYVIIGAPGVGKTTALLNSGLSFPLAKKFGAAAIRGMGGTRHCDWWFTNEAVFIDTAGRYTTHETDATADKAEWTGFLSLLKKNRSRQPINGVLLMLSVADLLNLNHEGRQTYAATMRRRLDELRNDLGM
jgi:type VI secretion system protein ImpL